MTNGEEGTQGKETRHHVRTGFFWFVCLCFFLFFNTIEHLYLQKNRLAAAYNFDELGIST